MTTAICIPSRHRPSYLNHLLRNIEVVTPEPHQTYLVVCDEQSKAVSERFGAKVKMAPSSSTMVQKVNWLARNTTETYFACFPDDASLGEGWLTPALDIAADTHGLVMIGPESAGGVIHRDYLASAVIDRPGYLLHPGYWHAWSDVELVETARYRGRLERTDGDITLNPGVEQVNLAMNRSRFAQDWRTYESRIHLFDGRPVQEIIQEMHSCPV